MGVPETLSNRTCQFIEKMLRNNQAMTDLKPGNTLFDIKLRKVSIIDLGGIL